MRLHKEHVTGQPPLSDADWQWVGDEAGTVPATIYISRVFGGLATNALLFPPSFSFSATVLSYQPLIRTFNTILPLRLLFYR